MKQDNPNYDIFISYSETDKSWAKSLSRALIKEGYKVFLDREKTKTREDNWEKTYDALTSCRFIIFVMSKNGLISDWEQMEVIAELWFGLLKRKKTSPKVCM